MKLALFATAAVAAAALAAPAFAQDAPASNYIQGNIGAGFAGVADTDISIAGVNVASENIGLDAGLFASVAAGHDFGNGLSLEVEGVYAKNDGNDDDVTTLFGAGNEANVQTMGVLANAKYAFHTDWHNVAPYIGAGVGYGQTKIELNGVSDDNSGVMWQAKAGLQIPTNEHLTWDIGYRFMGGAQYDQDAAVFGSTGRVEVKPYIHAVSVGARINF